ncbi:exported hypothetical protein [Candidatus Terasakiella magnetica]|uniref:AsmA domain-containing protein n=1 Tax=Candidatus Terasakiella magnetica TaxID=1867952 RepID=A0A1C3RIF3_9PROT|nr:AsmA family protein [Candidatus Terasakiella magnetica]SCA57050.1 exported hypothetical protein [Candidatus Terasakiella magnetica]
MKKVLIGLGVFVALVFAAILVVPSFIDWSGYRVDIAQKVKEATGRDLLIGGDISLSLLPSPVLKVSDVHFANAEGAQNQDMFSTRQLDVRVALMPLLRGTVHVQSIRMIEPTIHLEVLASGQGNWDFKTQAQAGESSSAPSQQAGDPSFEDAQESKEQPLPLQIDDFIIERGRLIFEDTAKGLKEEISDINSRFAIGALNGPFEAAATMTVRGIPIGFDGSVGKIVHGRTGSFAAQVKLAHGETTARLSGTLVNLPEGPKVKGKLAFKGESLAGLISAFDPSPKQHGGLNRPFNIEGEVSYAPSGLTFGEDGLSLALGQDRGSLQFSFENLETKKLTASASFNKIDGDAWLTARPYQVVAPKPLALVISPSNESGASDGTRVSTVLSNPVVQDKPSDAGQGATQSFTLPKDMEASLSLNVDALLLKGKAIRQVQGAVSLSQGELALERLSAILPGAGEVSVFGVAGERDGQLQFDGSLDLNVAHLRGALEWAEVDVKGVRADRLQQVMLSSQIAATPKELRLYDVKATMDGSTLTGATTIALRSRPSFGASLQLDRFNADAYLREKQTVEKKPVATPTSPTTQEPSQAKAPQKPVNPLEVLAFLDRFDANLDLSVGQVTYEKKTIKKAKLEASVFNGDVVIKKASVGSFGGVSLEATGGLNKSEAGLLAENLTLTAHGKSWANAAQMLGLGDVANWQKIGPVSLNSTLNGKVLAPNLDVSIDALGSSVIVAGQADLLPLPKGEASVNVQIANLGKVTRGLGLSYQPTGNPGDIELNSDVSFNLSGASLENITGKVGQSAISGKVTYKLKKKPFVDVSLKTGALRLDPFMAKQVKARSSSQAKSAANNNRARSGTQTSASGKWSREKIDFSALHGLDAKIRLQSTALLHKKVKAENVVLKADLKDGVLDVSQASANVFGGQLSVTSKTQANEIAQIDTSVKATGLKLAPLLKGLGSQTCADGTVALQGRFETQGQSQYDFISGLNGDVDFGLQKVSVGSKGKGGSPLDVLNLLAVLSGTNPSKGLADISTKAVVKKGVATLTTASLSSNIATGSATGQVDLPNWLIDISGALKVQQNALVGLLAKKAKMKQDYPFAIKGALDKPDVKLDTGGVSSGGGLIIPLPDKLDKKGYGNIIRGLLGGGVKNTAPKVEETTATPPLPAKDGIIAPPPPPPGGSNSSSTPPPSVEQQLLQGLGNVLKNR